MRQTTKNYQLSILCLVLCAPLAFAQGAADNSNLWPVHRDNKFGFHISYPPSWVAVPPKGNNVRFSISPPSGPGSCNVVARPNAELNGMSQAELNRKRSINSRLAA